LGRGSDDFWMERPGRPLASANAGGGSRKQTNLLKPCRGCACGADTQTRTPCEFFHEHADRPLAGRQIPEVVFLGVDLHTQLQRECTRDRTRAAAKRAPVPIFSNYQDALQRLVQQVAHAQPRRVGPAVSRQPRGQLQQ
jgi:hypothetical protein